MKKSYGIIFEILYQTIIPYFNEADIFIARKELSRHSNSSLPRVRLLSVAMPIERLLPIASLQITPLENMWFSIGDFLLTA